MIRNLIFLLGVRNLDLKKKKKKTTETELQTERGNLVCQGHLRRRLAQDWIVKATKKISISGLRIQISSLVWTRKGKQWAENPMLHLDLHDGRLLNRSIQLADEIITSQFLGRRGFTKRVQKRCVAFLVRTYRVQHHLEPSRQASIVPTFYTFYTFIGVSRIW